MLTLQEAGLALKTIKLFSYVGVIPYGCKVREGKLEGPPYYRLVFWYISAVLSTLHWLNALSQAVILYVLSDNINLPLHILLMHINFLTNVFIGLSIVVYNRIQVHDVILLIFNRLFKGEKMPDKSRNGAGRPTALVDLALRLYLPGLAFYFTLGFPLLMNVEPTIPFRLVNSRLFPAPIKESRILGALIGLIDVYTMVFMCMNFLLLSFVLYLSCEKVKLDGRAASEPLRLMWLKHRALRRAMKSVRSIQLEILLTNHASCWQVFAQKVVFIFTCTLYAYIGIRESSQSAFLGIFGGALCLVIGASWWITCYFANLLPKETKRLHNDIMASSFGPFFKADVKTFMKSVPPGYLRDGGFRAIERVSFLIFIDFVVNKVVALLLI